MNRDMETLLSTCLDQLEQGTAVNTILSRYPEESAELRPYLETAAQMSQLASLPTVAAQQKSREHFLQQAAVLRTPQADKVPVWFRLRRLLLPAASLVAVVLLLGYALITSANNAIPGDGLYPVKRTIENIRLINASNPQQVINLSEQFQEERLREIEALLRSGRDADVIFEGDIEALNITNWVISGLTVLIDNSTVVEGSARVGEMARVEGHTSGGSLFAHHISVLTGRPDPEETPLPAIIPTLELPETPSATPAVPAPTPSPSVSEADQILPVVTLTVTVTPLPTATAVIAPPTLPPAGNDNGDDGNIGNENGDESVNEDSGDNNNSGESDSNNNDNSDDGGDSGSDNNSIDNENADSNDNSGGEDSENSSVDNVNDDSGDSSGYGAGENDR